MIFPVFEERLEELRRDLRADAFGSDLPEVDSGMQKTLRGLARRFGLDNTKTECPSSVIDRWNDTILKGLEIRLSQREIRLLSRSAKIGLSNQFIGYLKSKPAAPAASVIRGLLASFVDTWEHSAQNIELAESINTWVNSPNVVEMLKWWRDHPEYWMDSAAHQTIAHIIIADRLVAEEAAKRFHLPQGSSLLRLSLAHAVSSIANNIDRVRAEEIDFLLTILFAEPLIGKECLDSALTAMVTSRMATDSEPFRTQVVNLVLLHPQFGDPRIQLHNWGNGLQQAKEIVLGWLSAEDIRTFFEIILSDADDAHGRKEFWLRYDKRIRLSRVFVANKDRRSRHEQLQELAEKGRQFGEAEGVTSIFVLDLGPVVAAEFSKAGNALYLYEKDNFKKVMKNFFAASVCHTDLKSQKWAIKPPSRSSSLSYRVTRGFSHNGGWQDTVRDVLYKYGITPSN
jgi:hypothetical protein